MIRLGPVRFLAMGGRLWTLAWGLMLGLLVCLYAAAVPAVYLSLASPPPPVRDALVAHNFSIQAYAVYMSALQGVFGLVCFAASATVIWHLPTRPFPQLVSVLLALCGAANPPNLSAVVEVYSAVEPLAKLAGDGQLMAYKHDGFWHPMDNSRDYRYLNELWSNGNAPWTTWSQRARRAAA